MTAGDTQFSVM